MWELQDPNICTLGISKSKKPGWSAQKSLDSFVRECVKFLQAKQLEERTVYSMAWKAFSLEKNIII